jgi:hypothetical protein
MADWVARGRFRVGLLPGGRARYIQPGEKFGAATVPPDLLALWQTLRWVDPAPAPAVVSGGGGGTTTPTPPPAPPEAASPAARTKRAASLPKE